MQAVATQICIHVTGGEMTEVIEVTMRRWQGEGELTAMLQVDRSKPRDSSMIWWRLEEEGSSDPGMRGTGIFQGSDRRGLGLVNQASCPPSEACIFPAPWF